MADFIAEFSLETYVEFAYKLWLSPEQMDSMLAQVPKWVSTDSYRIHALAEGNPTKDQMRLMIQSLLADRFKLAGSHRYEAKVPVLALVLEKPGKTGPKLHPHAEGLPCDVQRLSNFPRFAARCRDVFPPVCEKLMAVPQAARRDTGSFPEYDYGTDRNICFLGRTLGRTGGGPNGTQRAVRFHARIHSGTQITFSASGSST